MLSLSLIWDRYNKCFSCKTANDFRLKKTRAKLNKRKDSFIITEKKYCF